MEYVHLSTESVIICIMLAIFLNYTYLLVISPYASNAHLYGLWSEASFKHDQTIHIILQASLAPRNHHIPNRYSKEMKYFTEKWPQMYVFFILYWKSRSIFESLWDHVNCEMSQNINYSPCHFDWIFNQYCHWRKSYCIEKFGFVVVLKYWYTM